MQHREWEILELIWSRKVFYALQRELDFEILDTYLFMFCNNLNSRQNISAHIMNIW